MGGHRQTQGMGLVTGGLHHLRGHFQLPGLPLALGVQHTAGDHQLNKIGLILRDLPHQSRRLLRRGSFVGQGPGHVSPGHGHRHVTRQNPGAHSLAGEDLIPQAGVHRLDSAHGAQGGHAGEQLRLGIAYADPEGDGPEDGIAGHQTDDPFRVLLLDGGPSRGGQVDMEVNKPRHHIAAGQVDPFIIRSLCAGGDDGLDPVAVYKDAQARPGLHSFRSVQQDTVNQGVFHSAQLLFLHLFANIKGPGAYSPLGS